ncbi:MAG: type II secretion system protein [bacterium]|nr:type II secretion system protein [bacterium]
MKSKGFVLIETLIVMMIIGILMSFALPNYFEAKKTAQAVRVIADFEAIRTAVIAYYGESGEFPPDGYPGGVPKQLKNYLPEGMSFDLRPELDVRYDWENWLVKGKPKHPKTNILYGVSVTTKDEALVRKIKGIFQNSIQWSINDNYTFVIEFIENK